MKKLLLILLVVCCTACAPQRRYEAGVDRGLVPAETFTKSIRNGDIKDYSVYRSGKAKNGAVLAYASAAAGAEAAVAPVNNGRTAYARGRMQEDNGLRLKKSWDVPSPQIRTVQSVPPAEYYHPQSDQLPGPPPASSSPYHMGQMTANPSLWPDGGESASLFRDFRAHRPMDVITIVINESSSGKKKADTDASSSFDILAGITEFFGVETKNWASNNESLNPAQMVNASTSLEFEAEGETERSGTLSARISAVIMEQLPNGLLRVEGTKIVSINAEEEVLVISGLVRQRDITASNQVDSSRIANMRIDFYGQGVIAEQQEPGWGARIFRAVWPF